MRIHLSFLAFLLFHAFLTIDIKTQAVAVSINQAATQSDPTGISPINPGTDNFSISINTAATNRMMMQVVDVDSRVMETRNVNAHSIIKFGDR